jgi:hypothetical protein
MKRQISIERSVIPVGGNGLMGGRRFSAVKWCALAFGAVAMGLSGASCTATLDDGYKPSMLNASSSQRRAYYATPFTPEADTGSPDQSGGGVHRPGGF